MIPSIDIFETEITKPDIDGYRCQALVKVDGSAPYRFTLLIPISCYAAIVTHFGVIAIEQGNIILLFEARIKEYIANGGLTGNPASERGCLGVLDPRGLGSLFSSIDRNQARAASAGSK
jgi:hypothetical protein